MWKFALLCGAAIVVGLLARSYFAPQPEFVYTADRGWHAADIQ